MSSPFTRKPKPETLGEFTDYTEIMDEAGWASIAAEDALQRPDPELRDERGTPTRELLRLRIRSAVVVRLRPSSPSARGGPSDADAVVANA